MPRNDFFGKHLETGKMVFLFESRSQFWLAFAITNVHSADTMIWVFFPWYICIQWCSHRHRTYRYQGKKILIWSDLNFDKFRCKYVSSVLMKWMYYQIWFTSNQISAHHKLVHICSDRQQEFFIPFFDN